MYMASHEFESSMTTLGYKGVIATELKTFFLKNDNSCETTACELCVFIIRSMVCVLTGRMPMCKWWRCIMHTLSSVRMHQIHHDTSVPYHLHPSLCSKQLGVTLRDLSQATENLCKPLLDAVWQYQAPEPLWISLISSISCYLPPD